MVAACRSKVTQNDLSIPANFGGAIALAANPECRDQKGGYDHPQKSKFSTRG
jgi:hypothetical protein